jgi:hypothetical protein
VTDAFHVHITLLIVALIVPALGRELAATRPIRRARATYARSDQPSLS